MAAASPAVAVTNLIVNGSFETGDFTGFTHVNTAGLKYPAVVLDYNKAAKYAVHGGGAFGEAVPVDNAVSPSPDVAGLHAAYFVDDKATNEAITQLTALHPGNYKIGFDVYLPANGQGNRFDASLAAQIIGVDVAGLTASSIAGTHWFNFSGVAHIAKSGYYLTSFTYNSRGKPAKDFVVDKVFVAATKDKATVTIPPTPTATIPEPATWGLMIAGFVLVGVSFRRRARNVVAA